jgi:hypothetical protein
MGKVRLIWPHRRWLRIAEGGIGRSRFRPFRSHITSIREEGKPRGRPFAEKRRASRVFRRFPRTRSRKAHARYLRLFEVSGNSIATDDSMVGQDQTSKVHAKSFDGWPENSFDRELRATELSRSTPGPLPRLPVESSSPLVTRFETTRIEEDSGAGTQELVERLGYTDITTSVRDEKIPRAALEVREICHFQTSISMTRRQKT